MNDDQALVQAIRAGQPGAFERLVRTHQRLVWHVVQRLVRDTEDTRELCQETFLRVHRMLHQYRGDSRLGTWIGSVAYSIALRHLERRRIELVDAHDDRDDDSASLLAQAADPLDLEDQAATAQLQHQLHAAIERLAPLPRLLLTLYHLQELAIPEIEQITGVPAGTIKSHLFRARLQLRAALSPPGAQDD
jgi:RNA polymerase sigma factor (sigma-70 family)